MTMLSINHGAKGILMCLLPTTNELTADNGSLAKGPTGTCSQSIPGAELVNDFGANKRFTVDVNAWQLGYHLLLNVADLTREP